MGQRTPASPAAWERSTQSWMWEIRPARVVITLQAGWSRGTSSGRTPSGALTASPTSTYEPATQDSTTSARTPAATCLRIRSRTLSAIVTGGPGIDRMPGEPWIHQRGQRIQVVRGERIDHLLGDVLGHRRSPSRPGGRRRDDGRPPWVCAVRDTGHVGWLRAQGVGWLAQLDRDTLGDVLARRRPPAGPLDEALTTLAAAAIAVGKQIAPRVPPWALIAQITRGRLLPPARAGRTRLRSRTCRVPTRPHPGATVTTTARAPAGPPAGAVTTTPPP